MQRAELVAASLTFVLACAPTSPARAGETFYAKVVGVADGDTITVLREGKPLKIRLQGVDCPEKAQPFGDRAKQLTSKLVFGKQVRVEIVTRDKYGRTVARVDYLGKLHRNPRDRSKPHQVVTVHRSLQEELLQAGLAWWYRKYAAKEKRLAKLEEEARRARRGLWADRDPVAPWDFRHNKKNKTKLGPLKGDKVGDAHGSAAVDVTHPVSGNTRSKVYHWFTCPDLRRCKHCSARFKTPGEAERAGYRPHKDCIKKANIQAVRTPRGYKVAGVITKLPPPPPPKEPRSTSRTCKRDADCVFRPRTGCGCPPCGDTWRRAVSREAAARLRREQARLLQRCPKVKCARCPRPLRWLGAKAACVEGHCTVTGR
jgi:micrococcal nuclease